MSEEQQQKWIFNFCEKYNEITQIMFRTNWDFANLMWNNYMKDCEDPDNELPAIDEYIFWLYAKLWYQEHHPNNITEDIIKIIDTFMYESNEWQSPKSVGFDNVVFMMKRELIDYVKRLK